MFKIHNGNHKYCNININKIKLKEGRKDETYLVEFDGMLVGKFHIIIFSLLAKTGSVGPVGQLIKLVSPKVFPWFIYLFIYLFIWQMFIQDNPSVLNTAIMGFLLKKKIIQKEKS